MTGLVSEAAELQAFIENKGWDFFFIGGLVVPAWGEPRFTQDVYLTIFTNLLDEHAFISELLELYTPKFSDAGEFALTNRVLPLYGKSGIGIDITLGGLSDISTALDRSSYQKFSDDVYLRVCSAEDLFVFKTVAARPQDWIDVESVIIKQTDLDWDYIESSLASLDAYEDMQSRLSKLTILKERHYRK